MAEVPPLKPEVQENGLQWLAVRKLKTGRATSEEQQRAYQLIQKLTNKSDAKAALSENLRNAMIHLMILDLERSRNDPDENHKALTIKSIYKFISEESKIAESTIKRSYQRWKKEGQESMQADIDRFSKMHSKAVAALYK